MTPGTVLGLKLLLGAALIVGVGAGVKTVLGWREAAIANANTATQLDNTANATGEVAEGVALAQADQQQTANVVNTGRQQYRQQREELNREDADVALWNAGTVPVELRDVARQRRCARDGLGSSALGCARNDRAPADRR